MSRLRVLLVEDHALVREGLASLLAYQPDIDVVGEAGDAASAVEAARRLRPDLVLMDIDLPGPDGIAATRTLTAAHPGLDVVMLTVHDDQEKLFEALKAGAQGYLLKSAPSTEMLALVRGLAHGEAAISRRMAVRILEEFAPRDSDGVAVEPDGRLTDRELEILRLVVTRCTNKEIAAQLVISEHTVKNHLRNILAKLHVRGRRGAAAYAVARGWVRPPPERVAGPPARAEWPSAPRGERVPAARR